MTRSSCRLHPKGGEHPPFKMGNFALGQEIVIQGYNDTLNSMEIIKFSDVRDKVVRLRDQDVLLDADVAELYGVETKRVNEAVRNNPDKFPDG